MSNDMTMAYMLLAGVVGLAAYVHFKKKAKKGTGPLAVDPRGWRIEHSEGLLAEPAVQGMGWMVDIPMEGEGFLGAVKWYDGKPNVRVGGTLVLKCRVVGSGAVPREFPEKQARITVILQRRGDNGMMPEYRWYSAQTVDLVDGMYEIEVPINAKNMRGILGSHDEAAFQATVDNLWNIQIGFGSAGGAAHSVHAKTPCTFYMDSLTYKG